MAFRSYDMSLTECYTKEHRWLPEAGKAEELDSSLNTPEGMQHCGHFAFCQQNLFQISYFQNCKV